MNLTISYLIAFDLTEWYLVFTKRAENIELDQDVEYLNNESVN